MKISNINSDKNLNGLTRSEPATLPFPEGIVSVLSLLPDIIYRFDYKGRIVYISDAVRRYGFMPGEVIGKYLNDFVCDSDKEKASEWIRGFQSADGNIETIELRLFQKKREEVHFKFYGTSIREVGNLPGNTESDRFSGIQGIATDISELKKAVKDSACLPKIESLVNTIRMICHELSQPITVISGYSEILLMKKKDKDYDYGKLLEIKKHADIIDEIIRRLRNIVKYSIRDDDNDEIIGG